MTWTSAVGRSSKWLLYKIVHGLALTRISPNALTFIGLLINVVAGFLFGYANAENQRRMFLYAGLVIIGAGIFDMVDGRVARATNQVTQFGGFFDSVIDRGDVRRTLPAEVETFERTRWSEVREAHHAEGVDEAE